PSKIEFCLLAAQTQRKPPSRSPCRSRFETKGLEGRSHLGTRTEQSRRADGCATYSSGACTTRSIKNIIGNAPESVGFIEHSDPHLSAGRRRGRCDQSNESMKD